MKTHLLLKRLLLVWILAFSASLWGQAILPHTRTTWDIKPTGWTETNSSAYTTSFACSTNNGAKFDGNQFKAVQIDSAPELLSFVVKSNNTNSTSVLLVQESDDNITFSNVISLTGNSGLPSTCTTKGTYPLKTSTRYIKWTFTKGSSNMTMDDVSITKKIITSPTITTTGSFSNFTYIQGSGPSAEQSFAVSGSNLTNDVTITAPTNFEVSTTFDNGFANSVTLTQTLGTVASTTVYARMISNLSVNTYAGNVVLSTTGATDKNVALSGEVTPMPQTPVINAPGILSGEVGIPFTYQVSASENPTEYSYMPDTLPNGLNLDMTTGIISGTPTISGTFTSPLTASNAAGTSDAVDFEFNIAKGTQTVSLPDLNLQIGGATVTLPNSTNAELALDYSSDNASVATISDNVLTIGTAGTATITASNAGTDDYNAFSDTFTVTVLPSTDCTDLYFSEYVEGSSSNKYLEIFNPTNEVIDLSDYSVLLYSNGGTTAGNTLVFTTETIEPYGTFVIGNSGGTIYTPNITSGVTNFNGDDAIVLMKGTEILDIIGRIGEDPGTAWSSGSHSTSDKTLVRKSSVKSCVKTNPASGFPTLVSEWEVYNTDTATNLGEHESQCQLISIWRNGKWINQYNPNINRPAVIASDYSSVDAFEAQSLLVILNKTLNVTSSVKTGNVINLGNIILENNGNFVQTGTFVSGGSNSSFKVMRTSKEVKRYDYISWSSPMKNSGQTLKNFSYGKIGELNQSSQGTLNNRFYTYNNGNYTTTSATGTFVTGQGFQIRTPNDFTDDPGQFFNGVFTGNEPNSGTIVYDASGVTPNTGTFTESYVFLGNPYPGALDMEAFYNANPSITGEFYIWNSGNKMVAEQYSGSTYATYTKTGVVPANLEAGYVAAGQGFFVNRGANVISDFTFNNTMRTITNTGTFAKAAVTDKFWLQMASPSGAKPQMLIGFNSNATAGYDAGYDAKIFGSNADVIYSVVDSKSLIINARGSFSSSDIVNVTANILADGNYTLGIAQKEGIFANGQKVYLKDNVTNTETELTSGDYAFAATAGLQSDRFTISFNKSVLAASNVTKNQSTVYADRQTIYAKSGAIISSIEVYDMSGKLMKKAANVNAQNVSISVSYRGVSLVKMVLENGEVVTKKIILK
jgi:hypothetical protein